MCMCVCLDLLHTYDTYSALIANKISRVKGFLQLQSGGRIVLTAGQFR